MLAQNQISSPKITGEIIKEVLTLILGENAPIEQVDEAMAQMSAMQEAAQAQAIERAQMAQEQAEQEAQAQSEPSEEGMEAAALANGGV